MSRVRGVGVGLWAVRGAFQAVLDSVDDPARRLMVDEALRGRGIGAVLVRAAEEALAEQGCHMVEVTSHARRTEAHRFYEQLGYERTSVRLAKTL